MGMRSTGACAASLSVAFLLLQLGLTSAQSSLPWLTLSGDAPAIIAKGGFSGLFPSSSFDAYNFVSFSSSKETVLWCDVQLTKDGVGICLPEIILDNCTDITYWYPNGKNEYQVNGVRTKGWFSIDFSTSDLQSVGLVQGIYSRPYSFDSTNRILSVDDVGKQFESSGIWLNIQHDIFYSDNKLSMRSYILSVVKRVIVNYLSSAELGFLKGIAARFRKSKTKLIFRFLSNNTIEPSTNRTYGSLLNNLTDIKAFASGILVPKNYIWPVTTDNYLQPYTSIVTDAHNAGLEIYAADFVNDYPLSFNYSYDPVAEYLKFIDNDLFSVDGVVTDFPITPSEAIGCLSHLSKSSSGDHGKPLIISHNGASGDYADCTDLAYTKAATDGADVIDCLVQVTQDKTLICMSSADLIATTTVAKSPFASRFSVIREIKSTPGIYTFNLTWDEIKENLEPIISQPYLRDHLNRNPRFRNSGKFLTLNDFLVFAKENNLFGVLINVQNAVFMAEKLQLNIVDRVISAVKNAGYSKSDIEVMILSRDSSVLEKFKQLANYTLVYEIDESIGDALPSSLTDIKTFADSVVLQKDSIYPDSNLFITTQTDLVPKLHAEGLDVYVSLLQNEFISQAWDFLSDATVEINTFFAGAGVDGIVTDFPGTSSRYKRNSCRNLSTKPIYMLPIQAGFLISSMTPEAKPPALAPMPVLNESNVVEPPLPYVAPKTIAPAQAASRPSPSPRSNPASPSSGHRLSNSLFIAPLLLCELFLFA